MNGTGIFLCNFSGMIKNVLPSLRQRAGPQRICSRQKASAAALPVTPSRNPRTCGEKSVQLSQYRVKPGSPPHVRGKETVLRCAVGAHRITPAYTGKSGSLRFSTARCRDHPRVCGEKEMFFALLLILVGSPPRMRGKDLRYLVEMPLVGITPACAGKSPKESGGSPGQRDHPRMCGEKGAKV